MIVFALHKQMQRENLLHEALEDFGVITCDSHPFKFIFGGMNNRYGFESYDFIPINDYFTFNFWRLHMPTVETQYMIKNKTLFGNLRLVSSKALYDCYTDDRFKLRVYKDIDNDSLRIDTCKAFTVNCFKIVRESQLHRIVYDKVMLASGNSSPINVICVSHILDYYSKKLFLRKMFDKVELALQNNNKCYIVTNLYRETLEGFISALRFESSSVIDDAIMSCIGSILRFLSPLKSEGVNFNHSDLRTCNIYLSKSSNCAKGFDLLKLSVPHTSSITHNGVRFFNNSFGDGDLSPSPPCDVNTEYFLIPPMNTEQEKYKTYKRLMYSSKGPSMSYDVAILIASIVRHPVVSTRMCKGMLPRLMKLVCNSVFYREDVVKLLSAPSTNTLQGILYYFSSQEIKIKTDTSAAYTLCGVTPPSKEHHYNDIAIITDDNFNPIGYKLLK